MEFRRVLFRSCSAAWRSSRVSASFLHRPSTASSTSFISKKRSARTKWAGDTTSLIWQGRAAARPSIMAAQQRRPTFASFLFCAWPATRYSSFMLWAYTKYHALGNDYIVIDPKNLPSPLTTAQVKTICHRNFGIGSDGILLGPLPSKKAKFALKIYNPDGSIAEKSGNGVRIFSRYLWDMKFVGDTEFALQTDGGIDRSTVR